MVSAAQPNGEMDSRCRMRTFTLKTLFLGKINIF